ncbi:CheA signal transduction histidine kinase [[Synechococcus] sp. NIES-970]|nr:CheA signal transduction histidine kinase [[Synechococcus] sp. NIES-970]
MDTEQQVRLNFLEEVEEYFDNIEAILLELAASGLDIGKMDAAMRAAHSVKGGAAMMGFKPLSKIAHRMEDYFKILRVRQDPKLVTSRVETLLLKSVDALRVVTNLHRQGKKITDEWMAQKIDPIFDYLRQDLGDLREEDENALLAQEEDVDISMIIFAGGVEESLDYFDQQLASLAPDDIGPELIAMAEQLTDFGRMSELEIFMNLCQGVIENLPMIAPEHLKDYAEEALSTWRRTQALVTIGRLSHLPDHVPINPGWRQKSHPMEESKPKSESVSPAPGKQVRIKVSESPEQTAPLEIEQGEFDVSQEEMTRIIAADDRLEAIAPSLSLEKEEIATELINWPEPDDPSLAWLENADEASLRELVGDFGSGNFVAENPPESGPVEALEMSPEQDQNQEMVIQSSLDPDHPPEIQAGPPNVAQVREAMVIANQELTNAFIANHLGRLSLERARKAFSQVNQQLMLTEDFLGQDLLDNIALEDVAIAMQQSILDHHEADQTLEEPSKSPNRTAVSFTIQEEDSPALPHPEVIAKGDVPPLPEVQPQSQAEDVSPEPIFAENVSPAVEIPEVMSLDDISLDDIDLKDFSLEALSFAESPFLATEQAATEKDHPNLQQTDLSIAKDTVPQWEEEPVATIPPTPPREVETPPLPALDLNSTTVHLPDPAKEFSALSKSTVRVPVQQLQKLNTLFGKLIVERNAINLRLSQMRNFVALMNSRMAQLEQSNSQLRRWYDRASMEGLMTEQGENKNHDPGSDLSGHNPFATNLGDAPERDRLQHQFDSLEMDRYSDLHVLSQEQMESIVQLQEVAADIDLSLREINAATNDLNYTTRALQSGMTRTQMRPFSTIVNRFPRVMRDLSMQYGKKVNLKIEGETTLIDRVALEALTDPLNHLLRNAFDHGIEDPETRLINGKPIEGNIILRAMHRGNQTIITIQDDGGGIDPNKIRIRLRKLGIPEHDIQQMRDVDLFNMIFEPGFSTAERVSELSGRGVGMDVVKTNLKDLRGEIRVDTQLGHGTTFTIEIPLSVSILRVMIVETAHRVMAIPIDSIRAMISIRPEDLTNRNDQEFFVWEGQAVELIRAEKWLQFNHHSRPFEMEGTATISQPTALIVGHGQAVRSLHIDRFWGEQEISIAPVQSPIPLPPGFTSACIMGDGRVIPLVDPFKLLEWIHIQQTGAILQERQDAVSAKLRELSQPEATVQAVIKPQQQLPTILIIDDSINVRRYLALTLEKAGYQVEQAKDGQEAIDKLLGGLEVEAIICDIEMPRLDGYGVLSDLRSRAEYESLPITMLTSRMSEKHRKLAFNLGASAYFSKPYNEQELLQTLHQLIEGVKGGQDKADHPSPALETV